MSSLLIAAPYARSPVELQLVGDVVSEPYIAMTVQMMRGTPMMQSQLRNAPVLTLRIFFSVWRVAVGL